jgi:hypothetical protein
MTQAALSMKKSTFMAVKIKQRHKFTEYGPLKVRP